MTWSVVALAGLMLLMSVFSGPVMAYCVTTAEGLLDPAEYLRAVLGNGGAAR